MPNRYPFEPKSTSRLRPGDFWSIPTSGGRVGCGRVIALPMPGQTGSKSLLIAGLMNWVGTNPPQAEDLAGLGTVRQGQIHLRSILETGGKILGNRPLQAENIKANLFLSEAPGPNCFLQQGYDIMRKATAEEQATLPVFPTWGYLVIQRFTQALADSSA